MRYRSYLMLAASFLRVGSPSLALQNLVFALHFAPLRSGCIKDRCRRAHIAVAIEALSAK